MSEIKYEIVKKIGVLSKAASGWTKPPSSFGHFPQIQTADLGEEVQPDQLE